MPTRPRDASPEREPGNPGPSGHSAEIAVARSRSGAGDPSLAELGIDRVNHRELPAGFRGDVYIWDVDKTYLDTQFDSFKGLMRIPFEGAIDKRAFPGTAQLLKELRRGPGQRPIEAPLYFISASPPKLRSVLERKMLLDGVEFDGLTLKDPVQNVRRGGLRALKAQLAYKLVGLLLHRLDFPAGAHETLFGDDVESDALIYVLYADVVAGRIRGADLLRILQRHRTEYQLAEWIVSFADGIPVTRSVQRIFIHLAYGTDPDRFAPFGPTVIPVRDSLQPAVLLEAHGKIAASGVIRVAAAMREAGRTDLDLLASLLDLVRRRLVGGTRFDALTTQLARERLLPPELGFGRTPAPRKLRHHAVNEPWLPERERA
ncbi:MAG: hypothetical protein IPK07_31880 [Deltaproteobacteria bacterium]|nr:hypothetical protein [Deltaproteobacteria bacterium]